MSELLLDRAGRRRSPATMPGFHAGRAPGDKGLRYPADPPNVEPGERGTFRGAAGLARNEGLRWVHLRRIRDADLFEDRSQVLAERFARVLGLPDVDDAESARAFAGCVGKEAPDRPVRH